MNERDMAKRITQHLNYGASHLDREVLLRLQSARQGALELHAEPRRLLGLALAGAVGGHHHGEGRHHHLRFWLSLAALLAGLLIVANWHTMNGEESEDVDAALLGSDLPVHAYLDSDFDTWLEQSSRR